MSVDKVVSCNADRETLTREFGDLPCGGWGDVKLRCIFPEVCKHARIDGQVITVRKQEVVIPKK